MVMAEGRQVNSGGRSANSKRRAELLTPFLELPYSEAKNLQKKKCPRDHLADNYSSTRGNSFTSSHFEVIHNVYETASENVLEGTATL